MSTRSKAPGQTSPQRATEITTSVVIPVYNERENLPQLLEEIEAAFREPGMARWRPYEVVFVEDESDDGTAEWIDEQAAGDGGVRAIHLRRAWGQSAALAAGFDHARGEFVVSMDGDLQNDPADIPALLDDLEARDLDCVSGYRKDRDDPLSKRVPSRIQTHLAKLTGPDINDFGCTLKAYRADALDDIDLYGEGHRYIPAKLYDRGYKVGERIVNHRPRIHGESRYGIGRLFRGFSDLIWHAVWNRYSTRPMHALGSGGFIIMALGTMLGLWLVAWNYLGGSPLVTRLPELILAVGMVLFGLLVLILGMMLEFQTKLYYRDEREYRIERVQE